MLRRPVFLAEKERKTKDGLPKAERSVWVPRSHRSHVKTNGWKQKKISTKTKNVWDLWDLWDRALNGKDAYVKNMSIKVFVDR